MPNKKIIGFLSSLLLLSACSTEPNLINSPDESSIQANQVNKNYIPIFTSEADWGKHSQIAATYEELNDIKGNMDGIWDNEKDKAGTINGIGVSLPLRPLFQRGVKLLEGEFSTTNLVKALTNFKKEKEAKWGKPVTNLNLEDIKAGQLFSVQKAIFLTRLKRTPDQVTDMFVNASGSANGENIPARQIFCQRFKPTTSPNGKVVVVSPGFLESGRNFYEQADMLNKRGYDVLIMDHQWAGYTKGGKPGLADRGFGVARDTAAVTAFAKNLLDKEYASYNKKEVLIIGNSMGAGPGALGADRKSVV